jgi:hypothetical protein
LTKPSHCQHRLPGVVSPSEMDVYLIVLFVLVMLLSMAFSGIDTVV